MQSEGDHSDAGRAENGRRARRQIVLGLVILTVTLVAVLVLFSLD